MESESGKDLREYLATLRRHKGQIAAVAVALAGFSIALAVGLPPVYRASATILVQEQEVPPDLVRSTITSFADERIQVIGQQVMTRAVLLELVEKHDLYPKFRKRVPDDEIVERMRKDINLTTIDATISERGSGRRVNATIAFRIAYNSPNPESAQRVANALASLYLNENMKARQQSAAETTAFLTQEADRLARHIQEIESNLAGFKRRYAGRLPETAAVNMQIAERTEAELLRLEREISMLQDRRLSLESQLAFVKPSAPVATNKAGESVLAPEERLRALQAQYASASAVYGADHPDIRRMRREIAGLKAETGASGSDREIIEKRRKLEAELATLRERYSDDHPDVQRLKRSIAALEAPDARDPASSQGKPKRGAPEAGEKADNPAYVALANEIESAKRQIAQLNALRDDLRAKQRTYDARLLQTPEIEREYRELTRDYDNAQERYREVKAKQMQAEVAQELEKDRKAERFVLGEPATLPKKPASPNRLQILLVGLVASLGGGVGLAFLRDAIDPSVKGPLELARIARLPVLTAIPYIETREERNARWRRNTAVAALGVLIAVAFLLAIHFYLKSIPELWASLVRTVSMW